MLEKVEQELKVVKRENIQMKDKMQELLKQLDIYRNEVSTTQEYQKMKIDNKEEQMRKELEHCMKLEKQRILERQSELVYAYEEVSEDLKL